MLFEEKFRKETMSLVCLFSRDIPIIALKGLAQHSARHSGLGTTTRYRPQRWTCARSGSEVRLRPNSTAAGRVGIRGEHNGSLIPPA